MILKEKSAVWIAVTMYLGGCLLHVLYALAAFDTGVALQTLLATVCWNVPAISCAVLIRNRNVAMWLAVIFAMIGIYRIGYVVDTVPYALIVFMVGVSILNLLLDSKLLLYYACATNLEIMVVWMLHSDMILRHMRGGTYLLLVAFYESQLLLSMLFATNGKRLIENMKGQEQQLRSAVRSKDDFLANMSHEIRTPMNAVCGMCELILREDDISPSVRENGLNIQSAGRSLLAIINDLLDFSKVESGKMELVCEPYNISSVVNDIVNMSIARKGEKKLEVFVDCDPDIPSGLVGDEIRIRQVITNLMTNAIKYTDQGYVYLRVRQRRTQSGVNLQVSVRDTGMGIREEDCEKLFQTFRQLDTKKNRSKEGTGLGLALCKSLVRRMGGFIQVSSEYGKGSEFRFTIPQKVSDEEPIIVVKDREKMNVLGYSDLRSYQYSEFVGRYYKEIGRKLQVNLCYCQTYEMFHSALESMSWSHVFIGRSEYAREPEFFRELAGKTKLVMIQDRNDSIVLPPFMSCLYKPLYALSIASLLNGEPLVNSAYNAGAERAHFNFTAPGVKVLIVDDNTTNLKVAAGLLKPYQMQISTADSGKKAIELIETTRFDVVLMDHMMPEMDGVEATQIIRSMEGEYFQNVPIIALTANAVNGAKESFLASGMQDFIPKPIETFTMERVLKKWIPADKVINSAGIRGGGQEEPAQGAPAQGAPAQGAPAQGTPAQGAPEGRTAFSGQQDALSKEQATLRCINLETGYKYMGGNRDMYREMLEDYHATSGKRKREMEEALARDDLKNYTVAVHSLKSISLSLGITELGELAKELEAAGRAGDRRRIDSEMPRLVRMFEEALREIEGFLDLKGRAATEPRGEETSGAAAPMTAISVSLEERNEILGRLLTAVQDFEREEAQRLLDGLGNLSGAEDVRRCLEEYDFGAAEEAVERLLQSGE